MDGVYACVMINVDAEQFVMSDRLAETAATTSIVDRLFDIPETEVSEWDEAVARRLENSIAEMMRAAMRDEPRKKRA